jgi:hypothetical protein
MEGTKMKWAKLTMSALAVSGLVCSTAMAQRGVGEAAGVARQAVLPEVIVLTGKVIQVETGPCENTTGYSVTGTHFLMEGPKGKTLNIHLGPAAGVEFIAKELTKGKEVKVEAFRTEEMKKNHYVARTVTSGARMATLRDEALRPLWAGGQRAADGRTWSANPPGRGAGAGWQRGGYGGGYRGGRGGGPGWGRGQGGGGYGIATGQCPRFGAWQPVPET